MSTPPPARTPYPSDVSDEEWAFVAPYLALVREDAPQRRHDLREAFNGLRWVVRTGAEWRMVPHDFPRWDAVYQQTRRWLDAGVFEAIVHDLRTLLRLEGGRTGQPSAAILDSKTLQSTPESGARAGYDGHKRKKGTKLHAAVDTLGHLLALQVTPADAQDRAQVGALAAAVQEATGKTVELAYVEQDAAAAFSQAPRQIERSRCLADAALVIGHREHARHLRITPGDGRRTEEPVGLDQRSRGHRGADGRRR